jgi:hypothetical protein
LLTWRQEWTDDVLDRVVVERDGELFDAVGNIGRGKRRILKVELTVPFERVGLAGMQLKSTLAFIRSRVTDPITGRKRVITEDRPFEGDVRLTHDLPGGRWSWGVDASFAHREREFRLDAENFGSRSLVETRKKFESSRTSGILDAIETRRLRTSPIVTVSVRKSFGAAAD